jgi:glycosyltransferase involved in cell wall biosynthesis
MNYTLVSILMTSFNRQQFIAEAIESVISSKYENWELIIVDDSSKDKTVSIAEKYALTDRRIKVYINEINLGDYSNRNKAATYAKGKYLKYLDADDMIYPYTLNIMIEAMERYPEAALGLELFFYDDLNKPFPILADPAWIMNAQFLKYAVLGVGPSGAIIRTDIFRQLEGFSGKRYIGDTEMWLRLAQKKPVVFFQPALVFWRRHEEQEIGKERADISSIVSRHIINKKFIMDTETQLSESDRRQAQKKMNRRLISNIIHIGFSKNGLKKGYTLFKKSGISIKECINALY